MGVDIPTIEVDALDRLQSYPFPGNVRELESVLKHAIALSDDNVITIAGLNLKATHDTYKPDNLEATPSQSVSNVDPTDLAGQERQNIM